MVHFASESWFDLARNVLPHSGQCVRMQRHLDQGCERCGRLFTLWQAVIEIVRRERAYQPPDTLVRRVKDKAWVDSSLAGVRLTAAIDQQMIIRIPPGAVVLVIGEPDHAGIVDVEFQGNVVAVFQKDLNECAQQVGGSSTTAGE